jgi:hypothetical protein
MDATRLFRFILIVAILVVVLCGSAFLGIEPQQAWPDQPSVAHNRLAATYRDACGSCHLAYSPALLPAASWRLVLRRLPEHYTRSLSLADGTRQALEAYLAAHAADRSTQDLAREVLDSLGRAWPKRITEVAHIRRVHQTLAPETWARPGIGGRGDCAACHPGAQYGLFDRESAAIPRS